MNIVTLSRLITLQRDYHLLHFLFLVETLQTL